MLTIALELFECPKTKNLSSAAKMSDNHKLRRCSCTALNWCINERVNYYAWLLSAVVCDFDRAAGAFSGESSTLQISPEISLTKISIYISYCQEVRKNKAHHQTLMSQDDLLNQLLKLSTNGKGTQKPSAK